MANYSYVVTSKYNPFSYQELLAPVLAATLAHLAVENLYNTLSTLAETIRDRALLDLEKDPNSKWANRYLVYADLLQNSADLLAREGLNPTIRQLLLQANREYGRTLTPAINAIALLQKLSDAQYAQNPALRMVYGDMPSIDELIGDMTKKPIAYSGQDVYTLAATSSKAATARNVISDFMKDKLFAGYIRQIKELGYPDKTINDMLKNPALSEVVKLVKDQFNNFNGVSEAGKLKLEGEVLKGLFDGVSYSKAENLIYDLYGAQMRDLAFRRAEREAQQRDRQPTLNLNLLNITGATPDPIKLYSVVRDEDMSLFKKAKFFYEKDGKLYSSANAKQQYNNFIKAAKDGGISIQLAIKLSRMRAADALVWIKENIKDDKKGDILTEAFGQGTYHDRMGSTVEEGSLRLAGRYAGALDDLYKSSRKSPLIKYGTGDNLYYAWLPGNIGNLFSDNGASNSETKINESTAWRYMIIDSQNEAAIGRLTSDLGNQKSFTKVQFSGDSYRDSGTLDKKDFNSKNYKVLSFLSSPKGIVAEINGLGDKAGEHFFIKIPKSNAVDSINKIFKDDAAYRTIYGTSPEDKAWAEFMHSSAVSDLYNIMAGMVRQNQAKPQQFVDAGVPLLGGYPAWLSSSDMGDDGYEDEE